MKTKLILLLLYVFLGSLRAQLLNGSFETTVAVQNPFWSNKIDTLPQHWVVSSSYGSRVSNTAHTGSVGVVLWSWYYGQANGDMLYGTHYYNNGLPFSARPLALTGYYKFVLVNSKNGEPDSALIQLFLTKWNTSANKRDTIAYAETHLGASANYQQFSATVNYQNQLIPDTLIIYGRSSYNQWTNCDMDGFGNCNYLYLDDMALTMPVGINEIEVNNLLLFPNPATDRIQINKPVVFNIYNTTGEILLNGNTINQNTIDLSVLVKGVYFIQLRDPSGSIQTKKLIKE
jgi:hypothetical protein